MRAEIPFYGVITILTIHMKAIKVNREDSMLKHKSYKGKIQDIPDLQRFL